MTLLTILQWGIGIWSHTMYLSVPHSVRHRRITEVWSVYSDVLIHTLDVHICITEVWSHQRVWRAYHNTCGCLQVHLQASEVPRQQAGLLGDHHGIREPVAWGVAWLLHQLLPGDAAGHGREDGKSSHAKPLFWCGSFGWQSQIALISRTAEALSN